MPYIEQSKRPILDQIVHDMMEAKVVANGDLNYILFKLCKNSVSPSYNNYKNYIGELSECAAEIRRTLLADYEDLKMQQNGDVE
jgi:hypothetical protein